MEQSGYKDFFSQTIDLLNALHFNYLAIGGFAVNILGGPRMTEDLDLILFIGEAEVNKFLHESEKHGFSFNEKAVEEDINEKRTFRIKFGIFHLDVILSSTDFENQALKRRKKISIWDKNVYLPSPEDMIIFKVIPGRPKDLLDASNIYTRNKSNIDIKYIETWIQKFCDEAEDMRIYNNLKKVISGDLF